MNLSVPFLKDGKKIEKLLVSSVLNQCMRHFWARICLDSPKYLIRDYYINMYAPCVKVIELLFCHTQRKWSFLGAGKGRLDEECSFYYCILDEDLRSTFVFSSKDCPVFCQ